VLKTNNLTLQQQIFTPFYTSKKNSHGSGLGLSIAANIMQRHEGELYLKPRSEFTTFIAQLPVAPEESL
jgi:two-component system CheB/CheR fusion protein